MKLNGMLIAAALIAAQSVWAVEVASDEATSAVAGWVNLKTALGEDFTAQPANVCEYAAKDGRGKYYVVELEGGGFVVTSGDTELEPVLAYLKGGTWVDERETKPAPRHAAHRRGVERPVREPAKGEDREDSVQRRRTDGIALRRLRPVRGGGFSRGCTPG